MENNSILLSLCIPTNGVVEWILPVIESIYDQGVDNSLFEVVVTDNGEKSDLEEAVKKLNYNNFHYYRTKAKGFTNQIDAFEMCSGLFCKMLNHRSKMMPGSINALLGLVRKYQYSKPILYCAEGNVKGGEFIECANTDEFIRTLSYWISWSAGTGVWREDLKDIRDKSIDSFFPHTVFLLSLREESEYVIWNGKYEIMASDAGKGGYDLFYAFGVVLIDILNELRINSRISPATFALVKKNIYRFLCSLYTVEAILPTKHTFIIKNIKESLDVYFGRFYYFKMILIGYLKAPYYYLRNALHVVLK